MQGLANVLELLQGAWPTVQPAISTVFGAVVARLFLRGDTSREEFEKLKQTKFSEVADKLLEDGHITHLEYYKCKNFSKIAKKADEIYEYHDTSSDCSYDNDDKFSIDWFIRFFEEAGNISDEDMQFLWAKVLAGEIKHPQSFSLRTLSTLKNLSKNEAEVLKRISSYAISFEDKYYICTNNDMMQKYDYNKDLSIMYDCGIIENNIASHYNLTMPPNVIFIQVGSLICLSHNNSDEKYELNLQRFTTTGNEFIKLISPNEQYLIDLFRSLNVQYPKLNLTVHKIYKNDDNKIYYGKESMI